MINRRCVDRFAFIAFAFAWLIASPGARADQAFQRFIPFLVDLDGWEGKKPDGLALEMPNNSMITASRDYHRGPARFSAQVIVGPVAKQVMTTMGAINIETTDGHMNTSDIDGFKITKTYSNKDKSGAVMVALSGDCVFNATFNGLAEDEAWALAKKFDWKAIQAAEPK